jgi:phosphatidylserine decarboxylase
MRIHAAGKSAIAKFLFSALIISIIYVGFMPHMTVFVLALILYLSGLFLCWFFRDPERSTSAADTAILSGADGKVLTVAKLDHAWEIDGPAIRVSVFMSPLNVHVNRTSISGKIKKVDYRPGEYLMAFYEKSSEKNEANLIVVEDEKGRCVGQRQIAGFLARRVVCFAQEGDTYDRGARYGIIKLGSRMDHFLPADQVNVCVKAGDKLQAGTTVIGEWK